MLFIITQQVQPHLSMQLIDSQQAWIISQQALSPLVQVMQQPSLVISHLHMPMVRLQQQTIMPFIIMQQLHMPPASMLHRFCIMLHAIGSSQEQTIFMPPVHFSNFMVQRGTIIMFVPAGIPVGAVAPVGVIMPMPDIMLRSIIIVAMVSLTPGSRAPPTQRTPDGVGESPEDSLVTRVRYTKPPVAAKPQSP